MNWIDFLINGLWGNIIKIDLLLRRHRKAKRVMLLNSGSISGTKMAVKHDKAAGVFGVTHQ